MFADKMWNGKKTHAHGQTHKSILSSFCYHFYRKKIVLNKQKKPWALKWLGCICGYMSWRCKIYRVSYMCNGWNIVACIKDIYFKTHNCITWRCCDRKERQLKGGVYQMYIRLPFLTLTYGTDYLSLKIAACTVCNTCNTKHILKLIKTKP